MGNTTSVEAFALMERYPWQEFLRRNPSSTPHDYADYLTQDVLLSRFDKSILHDEIIMQVSTQDRKNIAAHMGVAEREATQEEEAGMPPWIRWEYDRGFPVAVWVHTGVITRMPVNPDPDRIIILRKVD